MFCCYDHCQEMPAAIRNICCMKPICQALTLVFKKICVDRENNETAICNLTDTFVLTEMYNSLQTVCHAAAWTPWSRQMNSYLTVFCLIYSGNLLEFTEHWFHQQDLQWINKGQLQDSVWIKLRFPSFAPPKFLPL